MKLIFLMIFLWKLLIEFVVVLPSLLNVVEIGVLSITFIAIAYYSLETRRMRIVMNEQLMFDREPRVDLYYYHKKKEFKVRNEGGGTAYEVEIGDVKYGSGIYHFEIVDPNPILAPRGDTKPLKVTYREWNQTDEGPALSGPPDSKLAVERLFEILDGDTRKTAGDHQYKDKEAMPSMKVEIIYNNAKMQKFTRVFQIRMRGLGKDAMEIRFLEERLPQ